MYKQRAVPLCHYSSWLLLVIVVMGKIYLIGALRDELETSWDMICG